MSASAACDLVAQEAWLLNTAAWDEWDALFSPSGAYWMPLSMDQTSHKDHVSLMYDTRALRAARLTRLKTQDGLSIETPVRAIRHLSNVQAAPAAENAGYDWHVRAAVMMAQYARGQVETFHALVQWHLQATASGLMIELKRADLLNGEGGLSDILVYV
ncbi:MAG: aromatic-ring-hydroxylating dioxygenase subunit beta [Pseudomonadota bacterium]